MGLDRNQEKAIIKLLWVCHDCGADVACQCEITGLREADIKKIRLFTWDDNKKRIRAEEEVLENKLKKIESETAAHVFRTAEFDCKCPNCGKIPHWSRFKYSTTNSRLGSFCFLASMLLFMIGFEKFTTLVSYSPLLRWAFLIPAFIYGIWIIFRLLHRRYYELKLRELDDKNFPSIKIIRLSSKQKIIHVKSSSSVKRHRQKIDK